jgi:hypothetical protein
VTYQLLLRNGGARPVRGVSLLEDLDDPRPSLDEFLSATEPDEARRNWFDRQLAWHRWAWLVARNRKLHVHEHAVSELRPGHEVAVAVEAVARRRGHVRLRGTTIARTDPLGLVRALRCCRAAIRCRRWRCRARGAISRAASRSRRRSATRRSSCRCASIVPATR